MSPVKHSRKIYHLTARNFSLTLGEETKIMGIINVTPDSFSRDGCLRGNVSLQPNAYRKASDEAVRRARRFIRQGVDILDLGGESSRPGSKSISTAEEIKRVIPALQKILNFARIPISVDTYKTPVAEEALKAGASIINNIKGRTISKSLAKTVKRYDAALVLMHMRGTPRTMQRKTAYRDVLKEIIAPLKKSIEICLEIGIKSDRIIIDPGIGFGKTLEHNLQILNRLSEFNALNCPILIGPSRKSFIGKILEKDVKQRLMGTAAAVSAGIVHGAHIVRVHDVQQIYDVVRITDAIINK